MSCPLCHVRVLMPCIPTSQGYCAGTRLWKIPSALWLSYSFYLSSQELRRLRADNAHVVGNGNFGPIRLRHLLEPLQDLPGLQALRQHGSATLWNRASEAHINGVEGDFFQSVRLIGTHGDHTAP